MRDLYSTLFYKIKFTIEAKNQEDDLLWKIVVLIKKWMTNKHSQKEDYLTKENQKWTELKNGGQIIGDRVKLISECCFVEQPFSSAFWACKIIENPLSDFRVAPRQWTTEIGIEPIKEGKVTFSCIISYNDQPGFIGECADVPSSSIPKLVRRLWEDTSLICKNGIDHPSIESRKILPGEWLDFWKRVQNKERTLPYIYISPKNYSEGNIPLLIDPEKLSLAIGGNAVVYYADDLGVTDEMNYFCPEEYKCYNGTVRIYYPNLDETQSYDAHRHRYLSADYIEQIGESGVLSILRRAIAQDAHFYEGFFRTDDCREKRESIIRQKRLEQLKKEHEQELATREKIHSEEVESIENDAIDFAEEAERKQLEAEDKATHFAEENKQLREENYILRSQNDSYKPLAKENADLKRVCNNRLSTKEYPQSPLDIFNYFDATFGDKIAFSEDAVGSLKDCTIPLEDLWKALFTLATIMDDLYINGSGDIFTECRNKSGIDVRRGEGTMTRRDTKLMRQFETEYHGETIDIEAHITYPKIRQSIHFGFSNTDQKLIVGWCGEHKDNYTTRKVH